MAARQIRAGRAFVELSLRDRTTRGLRAAQMRLRSFGQGLRTVGMGLVGMGAAITAPLLAATQVFAKMGDTLDKMSQRTGVSVEALSELGFAAEQSGSNLGDVENVMRRMQRSIIDGSQGLSTQTRAFEDLGLSVDRLMGMSPEEQFTAIAEALSNVEDPTRRVARAQELLGRSATKLLPLINGGAEGINALRQEARDLGLTVDAADAKLAAKFTDTLNILWRVLKQNVFVIGSALAPLLISLVQRVTTIATAISVWVRENRGLVVSIFKIGAALLAAGAGVLALSLIVFTLAAGIGGLLTLLGAAGTALVAVKTAVLFLLSPVGLLIAAVIGIGAAILHATGAGGVALRWLGERFTDLLGFARKAFQGIADALVAGDIGLAAKIFWLTLQVAWAKGVGKLKTAWAEFTAWYHTVAAEAFWGAAQIASEAAAWIQRTWERALAAGQEAQVERLSREITRLHAMADAAAKHAEISGDWTEVENIEAQIRPLSNQRELAETRVIMRDERLGQIEGQRATREDQISSALDMALKDIAADLDSETTDLEGALQKATAEWRQALADAKQAREERDTAGGPNLDRFRGELGDLLGGLTSGMQAAAERSPGLVHAAADRRPGLVRAGSAEAGRLRTMERDRALSVAQRQLTAAERANRFLDDIKRNTEGLDFEVASIP